MRPQKTGQDVNTVGAWPERGLLGAFLILGSFSLGSLALWLAFHATTRAASGGAAQATAAA